MKEEMMMSKMYQKVSYNVYIEMEDNLHLSLSKYFSQRPEVAEEIVEYENQWEIF